MTTYNQRPNADITASGTITKVGGAGSYASLIGDNSDSTYLTVGSLGSWSLHVAAALASIPSTETITQYRLWVRARKSGSSMPLTLRAVDADGAQMTAVDWIFPDNASFANYAGAWRTVAPNGTVPEASELAGIVVASGAVGTGDIADVWIQIETNAAPTATGTTPNGAVTTTALPTFGWTYADAEGDGQTAFRVRVYSDDQYLGAGFDPKVGGQTPIADSGEVVSGATSWMCNVALFNDTYRAYIAVRDSTGRWSQFNTSVYAYASVNVPLPATPVVTPNTDDANSRHSLTLQDSQNLLSADDASVESSLGTISAINGVTGYGCSVSRVVTGIAEQGGAVIDCVSASSDMNQFSTGMYPVVAGSTYTARAAFRGITAVRQVRVSIYFYNAGGTVVPPSADSVLVTEVPGVWVAASVTGVAPPTATQCRVLPLIMAPPVGEHHYIDGLSLRLGTTGAVWSRGGLLSSSRFQVQRSNDGGATWADLKRLWVPGVGMTDLSGIDYSDALQSLIAYDYEAPRGIQPQYRVRVLAGGTLISPWSTPATAAALASDGWVLKDIYDPTRNVKLNYGGKDLQWESDDRQGVFDVIGRKYPVVLSDTVGGDTSTLDFSVLSDAAYQALETLRAAHPTMLLQNHYGDHRYIQFIGKRRTRHMANAAGARKRHYEIGIAEVDVP